jgi:hypothetical protein
MASLISDPKVKPYFDQNSQALATLAPLVKEQGMLTNSLARSLWSSHTNMTADQFRAMSQTSVDAGRRYAQINAQIEPVRTKAAALRAVLADLIKQSVQAVAKSNGIDMVLPSPKGQFQDPRPQGINAIDREAIFVSERLDITSDVANEAHAKLATLDLSAAIDAKVAVIQANEKIYHKSPFDGIKPISTDKTPQPVGPTEVIPPAVPPTVSNPPVMPGAPAK